MTANIISNSPKRRNMPLYWGVYFVLCMFFLGVVLLKGYTIIAYDTPKELREMNTVVFAYRFACGENPYAVSLLQNAVPAATSMYGFLVPILLAPFIFFIFYRIKYLANM